MALSGRAVISSRFHISRGLLSDRIWTAQRMLELLAGSKLCRTEMEGRHDCPDNQPIQDRYSLRCLPQFLGPIVDGLRSIKNQIEVEANSANDNPLIDVEKNASYHAGNFLGQYIGVAMDHFRYYLGLLVKHLDMQIALLVSPELALIIVSASGQENVRQENGKSSIFLSDIFLSAGLDGRNDDQSQKHYDARSCLSPATASLYEAARAVTGRMLSREKPFIRNDDDQSLDEFVEVIAKDIAGQGRTIQALQWEPGSNLRD